MSRVGVTIDVAGPIAPRRKIGDEILKTRSDRGCNADRDSNGRLHCHHMSRQRHRTAIVRGLDVAARRAAAVSIMTPHETRGLAEPPTRAIMMMRNMNVMFGGQSGVQCRVAMSKGHHLLKAIRGAMLRSKRRTQRATGCTSTCVVEGRSAASNSFVVSLQPLLSNGKNPLDCFVNLGNSIHAAGASRTRNSRPSQHRRSTRACVLSRARILQRVQERMLNRPERTQEMALMAAHRISRRTLVRGGAAAGISALAAPQVFPAPAPV